MTTTTKSFGANVRFKSISAGASFLKDGARFRKASARGAFAIKPNGTGATHAQVPFARNAWVTLA